MTCNICPRKCGVDRETQKGFCNSGNIATVAKHMLHKWEEPSISGYKGSGAVFFSGCNLKCVYCQNRDISRSAVGEAMNVDQLSDLFLHLQDMGAHNVNLITATHFVVPVSKALEKVKARLTIPVVYNCGGYESEEALDMLSGLVDVYLPDFKYYSSELSERYSKAPDYFPVAKKAVKKMYEQTGKYTEDENGLAQKGVIIRHLVLPSCRHDSIRLLEELCGILPIENIRLSLMSQFTPDFVLPEYKELLRRVTSFEYDSVLKKAVELGFEGFFQQKESAVKKYTPDFLK